MIKFFRKIRQKLLSENKVRKYLLYAIGEIILVVIGILIALQINNWNENRKLNAQKQQYYQQLLEDLEKDKDYIEERIRYFDSATTAYNNYLETFKEPNLSINQVFANLSKLEIMSKLIGFNTSTIETLENTGDIKLIPLHIRNKLIDLKRKQDLVLTVSFTNSNDKNQLLQQVSLLIGSGTLPERLINSPELAKILNIENNYPEILLAMESVHEWKNVNEKGKLKSLKEILAKNEAITTLIKTDLE